MFLRKFRVFTMLLKQKKHGVYFSPQIQIIRKMQENAGKCEGTKSWEKCGEMWTAYFPLHCWVNPGILVQKAIAIMGLNNRTPTSQGAMVSKLCTLFVHTTANKEKYNYANYGSFGITISKPMVLDPKQSRSFFIPRYFHPRGIFPGSRWVHFRKDNAA